MPGLCKICHSDYKDSINARLMAGEVHSSIALDYPTSSSSVSRHSLNCLNAKKLTFKRKQKVVTDSVPEKDLIDIPDIDVNVSDYSGTFEDLLKIMVGNIHKADMAAGKNLVNQSRMYSQLAKCTGDVISTMVKSYVTMELVNKETSPSDTRLGKIMAIQRDKIDERKVDNEKV